MAPRPSPIRRFLVAAWLLGGATAAAAAPAAAQTVRGSVQDAARQPVVGVVVSVLDSTNAVIGRALSDERGEFRVIATRPGTVRIRAQRIGYTATLTDPFVLGAGATATPTVALAGAQATLAAVKVVASSQCGRADAGDAALLAVWEQANTSLAASLLTAGTRGLTTSLMNVRRVLDPGGKLIDQELGVRSGNMTAPWAALPIDTLRRRGYVWVDADNALTYNAPGIDGFVSPLFLEDHCFRLVASKDTSEIGIAFDPAPARRQASEIRGTFWVQRATAELRRADFSFTMPAGVPESPVPGGGTMRFARLPNGAVIIETWELRMPVTSRVQLGSTRTRVDQIQTTGGLVVAIRKGADTLYKRPLVTVSGLVRDSVSGRPLADAAVRLTGTGTATRTGPDGRFTLTDVLPGSYTLAVATPALDSMRAAVGRPLIVRDSLPPVVIRVPSEAQVAQSLCGERFTFGAGVGAVVGAVTRAGSTEGLANVPVVADWTEYGSAPANALPAGQGRRVQSRTDAGGAYRLCGVPTEVNLTVRALPTTGRTTAQPVRLAGGARVATVGIAVDVARPALAIFRGTVVADSTGRPIADAEVTVGGTDLRARTDSTGAFRLDEVPVGAQTVSVRKLGFAPMTANLTFAANDEEERRVVLSPLSTLDSVVTVADRPSLRLTEFEEHRTLGLGWFLGRVELERLEGRMMREVLATAKEMQVIGGRFPVTTRFAVPIRAIGSRGCPPPMAMSPPLAEKGGGSVCACFPLVIVDGVVRNRGQPTEPWDLTSTMLSEIEAMEWYSSPSKLPSQMAMLDSPCGVLVLHTRRAGERPPGLDQAR